MLTNPIEKFKGWLKTNHRDLFLAALVFLIGMASFGLGRLSVLWPTKEPIRIDQIGTADQSAEGLAKDVFTERSDASPTATSSSQGNFVASRNGSSYHLPFCPGAKQIKEENKIWFQTAEEAKAAGYKPAGNCPGL